MPRLTSKGQVTVPVAIRYALGLAPGDDVVFAVEDGRGVFRRATALDDLRAAFPASPRAGAHALERLLVAGDAAFADEVGACRVARRPAAPARRRGARRRERAHTPGCACGLVARALRDVLADRAVRVDHPAAVRAAIDELAGGGDALRAYALARG